MRRKTPLQLTVAVLAALGLAGPAFAQSTSDTPAQTDNDAVPTQSAAGSAQDEAGMPPAPPAAPMPPAPPAPPADQMPPAPPAAPMPPAPPESMAAPMPAPPADQMPPAPPAAPMPPAPPMGASASGQVTVTSHPGNSISSNYHVDFDAMDANHDGNVTRAEAKDNPDLMREFRVVDSNHNGHLSKDEMKGWM